MSVSSVIGSSQPARGGDTLDEDVPLARMGLGNAPRPLPLALATRASSPPEIKAANRDVALYVPIKSLPLYLSLFLYARYSRRNGTLGIYRPRETAIIKEHSLDLYHY